MFWASPSVDILGEGWEGGGERGGEGELACVVVGNWVGLTRVASRGGLYVGRKNGYWSFKL